MSKSDRVKIITALEKERGNSHLISYITSTRRGLDVPMSMDCIRKVYEHLRAINKKKKDVEIDLFIHSNGGDGTVPWRLVTLIREYTERFNILVPYKAFSAATLTALGADKIIMHPMGMLGPTDPTVTNDFNPKDDTTGELLGISVEDVTAYIALIKDDAGIKHEEELVQAFKILADKVHPLALGNVKRSLSQSRMMASKLLSLHMDDKNNAHKIKEIVDNLTSKLYFHGHPINREEALKQVELPTIENPSQAVEELMWSLYLEYEKELKMDEPFNTTTEFLKAFPSIAPGVIQITAPQKEKLVYVESKTRTDFVSMDYMISGQTNADGITSAKHIIKRRGWEIE